MNNNLYSVYCNDWDAVTKGCKHPALPSSGRYLWLLNCCGLRPQRTMAAMKRVTVTFQMLWPSATMNSGGLAAANLITKLGKISRNGNTALDRWSKCSARHSSMTSFDPILGWLPFRRAKWISVVVSKEELPTVAINSTAHLMTRSEASARAMTHH